MKYIIQDTGAVVIIANGKISNIKKSGTKIFIN